jgi:hypothetical protein
MVRPEQVGLTFVIGPELSKLRNLERNWPMLTVFPHSITMILNHINY